MNTKPHLNQLQTVLILEDEQFFSKVLQPIIKNACSDVIIAQTAFLRECKLFLATAQFDLLILAIVLESDIITPAIVADLRRDFPNIKILMLAANDNVDAMAYLQSGANHFLRKTANIQIELTQTIELLFG